MLHVILQYMIESNLTDAASMREMDVAQDAQDPAGDAGAVSYAGPDAAARDGLRGMGRGEEEAAAVETEAARVKRQTYYGVLRWNASSAYPDGAKYTGEIVDGAPHGRGALVTKYGLYIGEFVRGKRQGKGEFTSVSGDTMSGDWGDFGSYFPGTGTNWGGVLNGMGIAKYVVCVCVCV